MRARQRQQDDHLAQVREGQISMSSQWPNSPFSADCPYDYGKLLRRFPWPNPFLFEQGENRQCSICRAANALVRVVYANSQIQTTEQLLFG